MPILNDILDHEVLGPAIMQGRLEGLRDGEQKGLREGEQKGLQSAVRQIVEKRFGKTPAWFEGKLINLSATELQSLLVNVLDASSVDELFSKRPR